jgi:hypothetical protein
LFATLAAVFGVFLSFGAGSASAAAQCFHNDPDMEIDLQGDTAVVTKGNLSHINVNGVWCDGSATTSNTTYIWVYGNGDADTLVIDLSGGDFRRARPRRPRRLPERIGAERHRVHPRCVENVAVIGMRPTTRSPRRRQHIWGTSGSST